MRHILIVPLLNILLYVHVISRSVLEAHKTFHRYTVRAKRGTAQSVRDGQQGGHQPKYAVQITIAMYLTVLTYSELGAHGKVKGCGLIVAGDLESEGEGLMN